MTAIFVEHLISSAVVALLVAVACMFLRRRPALCHALWVVVLIKLLVPPVLDWPWTQEFSDQRAQVAATVDPVEAQAAKPSQPVRVLRLFGISTTADNAGPARSSNVAVGDVVLWSLAGTWVIGGVLYAGIQLIRLLRLGQLMKQAEPAPAWLYEQAKEICNRYGVPIPQVIVVPGIWSALTVHLRRAKVLIPRTLLEQFDRDHWSCILAHELAHIKRHDSWTGVLVLLTGIVWWWNPVLWLARRRLHLYAEMSCDAWAVAAQPDKRRRYADSLVRLTELMAAHPTPTPVLGTGSGPAVAFERRLIMILNGNARNRLSVTGCLLILIFGALVLPGWSQDQERNGSNEGKSLSISAREMSVTDRNMSMKGDVAIDIVRADNANFDMDKQLLSVSLAEKQTDTAQTAPAAETATPSPPSPPVTEPAIQAPPTQTKSDLEKVLDSPVTIEFENIHIIDIFEFLSDTYDVNILLDQRVVASKPLPPPPASKKEIKLLGIQMGPDGKQRAQIQTELATKWYQEGDKFEQYELKRIAGRACVLRDSKTDKEVHLILPPQPPPPPLHPERLVTNGMVPYIMLTDVPFRDALRALLRPLNLTYTVGKSLIWVSSPAMLQEDAKKPVASVGNPSENLKKVLESPVTIEFDGIHINEIVTFISDTYEINLVVDQRVVMPPQKPDKQPLGSPGYVTNGFVSRINLTNVPLSETLQALLRRLDLTYKAEDSYIWICSPELIDQAPLPAEKVQEATEGTANQPVGGLEGGGASGGQGGIGAGLGGGSSAQGGPGSVQGEATKPESK